MNGRLFWTASLMVGLSMLARATATGTLTPESVRQDLDAVTTAAVFEKSWGLVCPEAPIPVAEIKSMTAEQHADLTILPEQASFADGALVFTLGAKAMSVGAWNCENRLPQGRRVNLGVRFDIEVELEQSVADQTVWTLVLSLS